MSADDTRTTIGVTVPLAPDDTPAMVSVTLDVAVHHLVAIAQESGLRIDWGTLTLRVERHQMLGDDLLALRLKAKAVRA